MQSIRFLVCIPAPRALLAALGVALLACAACSTDRTPSDASAAPAARATEGDKYYLSTCAMCDSLLGTRGDVADLSLDGRNLRFCNAACRDRFDQSRRANLARIDAALVRDQLPHYPLTTSIVSGGSLGANSVDLIADNRLFRVRDESERAAVLARRPEYFDKLDAAVIAAQTPTYAMPDKCPVQGDILDSDSPIDIVIANRMIRVCCQRCVRVVRARPSQYLSMVDYANRAAAESSH